MKKNNKNKKKTTTTNTTYCEHQKLSYPPRANLNQKEVQSTARQNHT